MWDISDTLVTHAFPEREVWLKSCGDGEPKGNPTVRLWFPRKRFAAQRGLWTSRVSISWEFLRNSRFSDPTLMWNENLHFSILQMGSASFKLRTELGCVFLTWIYIWINFWKQFAFIWCVWVFSLHVCMCTAFICVACGVQKRVLDPLELGLWKAEWKLPSKCWELGTQTPARAASALNTWAISPGADETFKWKLHSSWVALDTFLQWPHWML